MSRFFLVFLTIVCVACCRLPDPRGEGIVETIYSRSGYDVQWDRKSSCRKNIAPLLSQPLDVDAAVQIALYTNPKIQALFEELGIAEADLVNASLIDNPMFGASVRFPDRNTLYWKTEMDLIQPIISLLLLPVRKKTASLGWLMTKAQITDEIFAFIEHVSTLFFSLKAQMHLLRIQESLTEVMELKYLVAQKQENAGASTPIEIEYYLAAWQNARIVQREMEIEKNALWRDFVYLLGFPTFDGSIRLTWDSPLPPLTSSEALVKIALENRLDAIAIRLRIQELCQSYGLYDWWVYSETGLGVAFEKETDGEKTIGPALSLSIPIFNWGQGDRAQVIAEWAQNLHMYCDKQRDIVSQVFASYNNLNLLDRQIKQIQQESLPNNHRLIDQLVRLYNFMNAGVFTLLDAKAMELQTEMVLTKSYRDYWIEQARLSRSTGGFVPC